MCVEETDGGEETNDGEEMEGVIHCWYEADQDYVRTCDGDFEIASNNCICQINGFTVDCTDPLLTKTTCPGYVEEGKKKTTTHTHPLRLLGGYTTPLFFVSKICILCMLPVKNNNIPTIFVDLAISRSSNVRMCIRKC